MVSRRVALIVGLIACSSNLVPAADEPAPAIEDRPYKVRAFVSFAADTRIDDRGRDRVVVAWLGLCRRLVGAAWEVELGEGQGAASAFDLDSVAPGEVQPLGKGVDKVWLIRGRADGGGVALLGRELDVATGWLGSPHARRARSPLDLPREVYRLAEEIFAPYAEIGEPKAEVVPLRVQGAAIPGGISGLPIAPTGSVFRPIRVFYKEDGSVLNLQKILYSYLLVTGREGGATESSLIRGVQDPLTRRVPRKNKLIALGIKPGDFPTRLHFVQAADKQPAAGYVLTSQVVPNGLPRDVATTDREGRVTLPPGFADGLVILRLIAGRAEPTRQVPMMPGETDEEITIPIDPRPLAIALETKVDALRDTIVDLVAIRSRLERRMKAREQGDDWAGVEQTLVEFRNLPPRDGYVKRLDALLAEAEKQEAQTKAVVLTKAARAQIAETRGLIDRYLDDELYRAYEDAVLRAKERDNRAKAKAKPGQRVEAKSVPDPVSATPAPAPKPAAKAATPPPPANVVPF